MDTKTIIIIKMITIVLYLATIILLSLGIHRRRKAYET